MAKRSSAASPDEFNLLRRNISELKQLRTYSHPTKRKESLKKQRKKIKKPLIKRTKYFSPAPEPSEPEEVLNGELSMELSFSKYLDSPFKSNNETNISEMLRTSTDTAWNKPPTFNSYPLANESDKENTFIIKENNSPRPLEKPDPDAKIKSMYKAVFHAEKQQWKTSIHEAKNQSDAELQELREEIQKERIALFNKLKIAKSQKQKISNQIQLEKQGQIEEQRNQYNLEKKIVVKKHKETVQRKLDDIERQFEAKLEREKERLRHRYDVEYRELNNKLTSAMSDMAKPPLRKGRHHCRSNSQI